MKAPQQLEPSNKEEARLLEELDRKRLPEHVAVIMDGNGRWAQRRHLPRIAGHRAGVRAARGIIETCARLSIPALTLYAFSMENWRRPRAEIDFLMRLLREYLRKELPVIHKNNIRLLVIGRGDQLPQAVREDLDRGMESDFQEHGDETGRRAELRRPRGIGGRLQRHLGERAAQREWSGIVPRGRGDDLAASSTRSACPIPIC